MRTKQKTTIKEKRFVIFSASSHGKTVHLKYSKQRLLDDYENHKRISNTMNLVSMSIKEMIKVELFQHLYALSLNPEKYHLITYH